MTYFANGYINRQIEHHIILHVGRKLRELRMLNGFGQAEISKLLGVSFQ
tara:strand:- start:77 stop:223 length:147 start_codon:yes stop_codon:yes gene_type:complete